MPDATPLLELRGITKRFPGVLANDAVDFDVAVGEVHALLGENGAGKSTLMKVLYGLYRPDEGEVRLHGAPSGIATPAHAIEAGVAMIHQHFMLVPTLTVAENVALGLSSNGLLLDTSEVAERILELSTRYGLHVDPSAYVWQLAVGERQRVEIIKALYRDCRLLILDEPTAVLTPIEVDELFVTLRTMATDGVGLIFISHKLDEVLALADRITVMRDGRVTGETAPSATSRVRPSGSANWPRRNSSDHGVGWTRASSARTASTSPSPMGRSVTSEAVLRGATTVITPHRPGSPS